MSAKSKTNRKSKKGGIVSFVIIIILALIIIISFAAYNKAALANVWHRLWQTTEEQTAESGGGGSSNSGGSSAATTGLKYVLINNNTGYTMQSGTAKSGAIVIPAAHNGLPVVAIDASAFENCTITSIIIPDSVTRIEQRAFYGCANLPRITLPNRLTRIETNAFNGCTSLTSVTIPNSVGFIGTYAFNCNNLVSVTFQGMISSGDFSRTAFPGDLRSKYFIPDERSGGIGTYTRPNSSSEIWLKK